LVRRTGFFGGCILAAKKQSSADIVSRETAGTGVVDLVLRVEPLTRAFLAPTRVHNASRSSWGASSDLRTDQGESSGCRSLFVVTSGWKHGNDFRAAHAFGGRCVSSPIRCRRCAGVPVDLVGTPLATICPLKRHWEASGPKRPAMRTVRHFGSGLRAQFGPIDDTPWRLPTPVVSLASPSCSPLFGRSNQVSTERTTYMEKHVQMLFCRSTRSAGPATVSRETGQARAIRVSISCGWCERS
jgi:hypothetical protein